MRALHYHLRLVHNGLAQQCWRRVAKALLSLIRFLQILVACLAMTRESSNDFQHLPEILRRSHQLLLEHFHDALIVFATLRRRVSLHPNELLFVEKK